MKKSQHLTSEMLDKILNEVGVPYLHQHSDHLIDLVQKNGVEEIFREIMKNIFKDDKTKEILGDDLYKEILDDIDFFINESLKNKDVQKDLDHISNLILN